MSKYTENICQLMSVGQVFLPMLARVFWPILVRVCLASSTTVFSNDIDHDYF